MGLRFIEGHGKSQIGVDAGQYNEGAVLKNSSTAGRAGLSTAKGDTAIGIVETTEYNWGTETVKTFAAGDKINYWPLGCRRQVRVRAATGLTIAAGDAIYLTTSALVTNVDPGAARTIGHAPYDKASQTTSADGDTVWVYLDSDIGADLTSE